MIDKIKKDIFERSVSKNLGMMPNSGHSEHEFNYRICVSSMPELKDYYFVVSKVMKYQAGSMTDFGYNVYVYNSNGEYTEEPEVKAKCKGRFFQSITEVE